MFSESDLISIYTRKQAIEDGVLVDVSKTAKEANFLIPTAMTETLWTGCIVPDESALHRGESIAGRLWDLLWMLFVKIKASKSTSTVPGSACDTLFFSALFTFAGKKKLVRMKAIIGPGDEGEPVLTIMFPSED